MIPAREALASLLLLLLLTAALFLVQPAAGPGPLALLTGLAALHAALLAPAIGKGPPAWGLLPLLLCLPALGSAAYGHPGAWPLLGSLLLVTLASLAGVAARALKLPRVYLPSMILLFAAPYALHYLVVEWGDVAAAAGWRSFSPWAAAEGIAAGHALPAAGTLLLLAWPVWAVARRGRP